ncbi:RNA-binding protein 33-like [Eucalyptus grandis]|uniref:RNA-binding protein 33-like n=1 Tax=Eucalyptus grandis TaxID=71139 RepID=UPI00192EB804|nr:RNA-binding protein 33-like [Eucalyptus grandis]
MLVSDLRRANSPAPSLPLVFTERRFPTPSRLSLRFELLHVEPMLPTTHRSGHRSLRPEPKPRRPVPPLVAADRNTGTSDSPVHRRARTPRHCIHRPALRPAAPTTEARTAGPLLPSHRFRTFSPPAQPGAPDVLPTLSGAEDQSKRRPPLASPTTYEAGPRRPRPFRSPLLPDLAARIAPPKLRTRGPFPPPPRHQAGFVCRRCCCPHSRASGSLLLSPERPTTGQPQTHACHFFAAPISLAVTRHDAVLASPRCSVSAGARRPRSTSVRDHPVPRTRARALCCRGTTTRCFPVSLLVRLSSALVGAPTTTRPRSPDPSPLASHHRSSATRFLAISSSLP